MNKTLQYVKSGFLYAELKTRSYGYVIDTNYDQNTPKRLKYTSYGEAMKAFKRITNKIHEKSF